ncbi:unnamed protein product [Boreogadus saida]
MITEPLVSPCDKLRPDHPTAPPFTYRHTGPSHRGPRLLAPCLVAPLLVGPRAWWGPPSGGPRLWWSCSWLAPCLVGPGPGGILRVVAPASGGPCICRGPGLAPDRSMALSAWRIPTLTVKQQMTQGALEPAD